MKKRLFSILLSCCMVLTKLPTAAFAEDGSADAPQCICETACTVEQMNRDCPICGADDAAPEHCGKHVSAGGDNTDREDDNNNPVGGVISLEGATGDSENPPEQDKEEYEAVLILGDAVTNYQTVTDAMTAAQKDENRGCTVKLLKNVTLAQTLLVNKGTLTLDLAGFYLAGRFGASRATVRLEKKSTADLTIMDSRSETGTGYIENSTPWGDSSAVLAGGGKLTIESGRFLNGLQVDDKAQVKINGGIFVRIRPYNFEWGANAGGFTVKVTDGRQVHDLLREGCELYYAKEDRFVNCRVAKMQFEEELMLNEHPKHNSDENGKCDCGYICSHKEFSDGVCTSCGTAAFVKLTDSAGTETKYFVTLADAFNAVPGKSNTDTVYTVTPLGSRKFDFDWIQVNGKRVTLDLNKKTLSCCHIQLVNGAELTVTGNGTMNDYSAIMVNGACKLYVRNGTIDSVSVGNSTTGNNGTVYLQGGTIGLSIYERGDAVLTGGTLTSIRQADATAMGMAESVRLRDILPKGYALKYVSGKQEKLPRDTEIKNNDDLERRATCVVCCDHKGRNPIQNGCCIYCGAENRIYYDLGGGSMDGSNPTCYSPGEEITLSNPIKKGYTFTGWSCGLIEGVMQECNVTVPTDYTGEIRFFANWVQKGGYTVRFDTGGGTPISDRTNLLWGDRVLSGVPQPEKAGYVFLGWKCNNKDVDEELTVYGFLADDDSVMTVTLTAQWRQKMPPVLEGLTANAAYCEGVSFTVSGDESITEVKVGDTVLTADPDGRYTLRGELGTVTVTASDEDGQTTSVTVAVYGGHAFGAWSANGDGTHSRTCSRDESHTEQKDCTGGTATCKEKAVCTVCHHAYGAFGTHSYTAETVGEAYLVSPASCTEAAVYHKSCAFCGTAGTDTFVSGTALGHAFGAWSANGNGTHSRTCTRDESHTEQENCTGGTATCKEKAVCTVCHQAYGGLGSHSFTKKTVGEAYLVSPASCTEAAVYHKSCAFCGTAGTDTFVSGTALGHTFGAWSANGNGTHSRTCTRDESHTEQENCTGGTATCKEKAVCTVCHHAYGGLGAHSFTAKTVGEAYLVSPASCTEAAVYHKSCAFCGTAGTDTFVSGTALGHTFGAWSVTKEPTTTQKGEKVRTCSECDYKQTEEIPTKEEPHRCVYNIEKVTPKAFKTAADCTHDAVYYKSCSCGAISSTETFAATGTMLGHNWTANWRRDIGSHWRECTRCHDKKDVENHRYGDGDICGACGYDKSVPANPHTGAAGLFDSRSFAIGISLAVCLLPAVVRLRRKKE